MTGVRCLEARSATALGEHELEELRALLDSAFGGAFDDHDFAHCLGGTHLTLRLDGELVSHAAVVPRRLYVGEEVLRCGYVEGVATAPAKQRRGYAGALMRTARGAIDRGFDVGALSTGVPRFYEPLGWERWQGPTFVLVDGRRVRTPDEDDGVMVTATARRPVDVRLPIAVDWRPGDSW